MSTAARRLGGPALMPVSAAAGRAGASAAPEGDLESAFFGALQGPQQVTQTADNVFLDGAHGRIVLAPAARDTGAG